MENLKPREEKILEYMKEQIKLNGYPPTVREICAALNIKSTSTVHKDIANLEKKGFLSKDPSKNRALNVIGMGSRSALANDNVDTNTLLRADIVDVPVVGRIAAGTPILAEENLDDSFPVPSRFVSGSGTNFMLTVKGESMIEAGIMDGDYILVEQKETANNGEIVVAMIEDGFEPEATVKTFYKEADHIRLQPENATMKPIITRDVKILGKVKGVFRYFS